MSIYGFIRTIFVSIFILCLFLGHNVFAQMVATSTFNIVAYVAGDEDDGSSGSGGDGSAVVSTEIVFSGYGYPSSYVRLLKDGEFVDFTMSNITSNFILPVDTISAGTYSFSLYAIDSYDNYSNMVTYSVEIIDQARTEVSGVVLPPTAVTDVLEVEQGEIITIYGQAIQDSIVTIVVEGQATTTVQAVSDGLYEYNLDTTGLSIGEYSFKVMMNNSFVTSPFTNPSLFTVVDKTSVIPTTLIIGDINYDDSVNIVDFSIMAYWYEKPLSEEFLLIESERLSGDGVVNLIDFSLMAYYWTG